MIIKGCEGVMNEIWGRRECFPAIGIENRAALMGKDSPVRGKLSSAGFGLCSKLAISGITETGHDIAVLVKVVVNRGQVDWHVRVGFVQALDAFRCADQTHELDLGNTPVFEDVHGRHGGATGRQHRVEDQADGHSGGDGQFVVIGDGLERALIAVEADMPNFGGGH